jgi:hypothetical protein
MLDLGDGTKVGGWRSQQTSITVQAGITYYIWVYGFNFEQGSYNLDLSLTQ